MFIFFLKCLLILISISRISCTKKKSKDGMKSSVSYHEQLNGCWRVAELAFPFHLFNNKTDSFRSKQKEKQLKETLYVQNVNMFTQLYYECITAPTRARLQILIEKFHSDNIIELKAKFESMISNIPPSISKSLPSTQPLTDIPNSSPLNSPLSASLITIAFQGNFQEIARQLKEIDKELDQELFKLDHPIVIQEESDDYEIEFSFYPKLQTWTYLLKTIQEDENENDEQEDEVDKDNKDREDREKIYNVDKRIVHQGHAYQLGDLLHSLKGHTKKQYLKEKFQLSLLNFNNLIESFKQKENS